MTSFDSDLRNVSTEWSHVARDNFMAVAELDGVVPSKMKDGKHRMHFRGVSYLTECAEDFCFWVILVLITTM